MAGKLHVFPVLVIILFAVIAFPGNTMADSYISFPSETVETSQSEMPVPSQELPLEAENDEESQNSFDDITLGNFSKKLHSHLIKKTFSRAHSNFPCQYSGAILQPPRI